MATIVDSGLWIQFARRKSSRALKALIAPFLLSPEACVTEPVIFEVLRHASDDETPVLQRQFSTMALLPPPTDLWERAVALGQTCRKAGIGAGSMDLLIAVTAVHHRAELVTFDQDYERIASVSKLKVKLLAKP